MAQLDATVVNVSLASLAADLHVSLSAIQWVTSGYLLALALTLPLNGWLVDRIGAKALYLWCFAAFTLSSALCGLAWSADALIAFRIFQGMSGGLLAPMAQMMIARAAGRHMAQVVSVAALPVLLGPLLGPVIAGAILQFASWRWLFLINLPVGVVALSPATDPRPPELFGPLLFRVARAMGVNEVHYAIIVITPCWLICITPAKAPIQGARPLDPGSSLRFGRDDGTTGA